MNTVLLIIFVLFPLATIIHELGHYVTARLSGLYKSRIQVGVGPTILHIDHEKLKLEVRLFYFIGANTNSGDLEKISPYQRLLITVNGPLFNTVVACLIWVTLENDATPVLNMFAFINMWIAVGNMIPLKIGARKSDGYIVLQSMWNYIKNPGQI